MIQLEAQTNLSPAEALELAERFFGSQGYGLAVQSRNRRQITLVGGGGSVVVAATRAGPNQPAMVQIQAREWDAAAKEFVLKLPRPRRETAIDRWLASLLGKKRRRR